MRYIVVTGGPLPEEAAEYIKRMSAEEDSVTIACDSGADILARHDIVPDMLVGDMDSISDEALGFMESHGVFTERYPVEKDWTDTEIAMGKADGDEIVLICPVAGRIDHVTANLQLAMKYRKDGGKITVTDGKTLCCPLSGEDSVDISLTGFDKPVEVSLIPWNFDSEVTGVTTKGLYYPLENASLTAGTSFSFSNCPVDGADRIGVSIKSGMLLVTVTEAV